MAGNLDLDLLEQLVAVADTGSFSAAASALGIAKSSLSRGISRLEQSIGARLVHRTTRRVSLSTAGIALYERAAPLLRSLRDAIGTLPESEEEPSGELRITAPNDFGAEQLSSLIPLFTRRYPGVRVDVRLTNRTVDLVAEGFDLAIRAITGRQPDSSLVMRRLGSIELGVFAAPGYLARRGTPRSPEEGRGHDWVIFRSFAPPRDLCQVGKVSIIADDFLFIRNALRSGAGIGLLPTFLGQPDVTGGRLVRVMPRQSQRRGAFVLLYPKALQQTKKLLAFRDFLFETLSVSGIVTRAAP